MLTIAIGPEFHDIHLLHDKKQAFLGRIMFNVQCSHIEDISLEINSIICKLDHCFYNEIVFRLKYMDNHSLLESDYTQPIKAITNLKEDGTAYNWTVNEKNEDSTEGVSPGIISQPGNSLKFEKMLLSLQELKGASLQIYMSEVKYELQDHAIKRASSHFGTISSIPKMDDPELSAYGRMVSPSPSVFKRKADPIMGTIILKECDQSMDMKLKFNDLGYSRINFYKVLSEKDNAIQKQSSNVFQTLSYLYRSPNMNVLTKRASVVNPHNNFVEDLGSII